jgi:hypothetical protein
VARAPADGDTLLIAANNVLSVNPARYRLALRALAASDLARWTDVIRSSGIVAD